MEKVEWCDYTMVKKFENSTFTHFDTIHERDRQTDGQSYTGRRHKPRSCVTPGGERMCNARGDRILSVTNIVK